MKNCLFILFTFLLCFSCFHKAYGQKEKPYSYKINENIPDSIKNNLHKIDSTILSYLRKGEFDKFENIMSPRLKEKVPNSAEIVSSFKELMPKGNFSYKDEYWIKHATPGTQHPIISPFMTYYINHNSSNEEEYVSLRLAKDKLYTFMLLSIYTKGENGWNLETLTGGVYSTYGKTGLDYYQLSQRALEKGYILNAYLHMLCGKDAMNPGGPYFQYQQKNEVIAYEASLVKLMVSTFQFPRILEGIEGKPEILGVQPQIIQEGIFPLIIYQTDISLDDKQELERQNDQVKEKIEDIFPGIRSFGSYLLYRVFNRETIETGQIYQFIEKNE
ncbi:MAG: hypothetical protein AAFY71_02770 [Bacteroidota bacterium]